MLHTALFWVSMVLLGHGAVLFVRGDHGGILFLVGLLTLWLARRIR